MSIIASLVRTTLIEAVRNRLLWLTVVVVVVAFGLAQFLNQVAIAETREIQAALVAAPVRIAAVFIVAVFVYFNRRAQEREASLLNPAVVASAFVDNGNKPELDLTVPGGREDP